MVGIVIVSHSARLAEGVAELAREMGGPQVALEVAGGLDMPGRPAGTDAALVLQAIERAYSDDGVLVLMDLGSAVLSAEMALDFLPPERRERVVLCEAPIVEGAVAAAVTARLGASLPEVAAEARSGLKAKAAHLAPHEPPEPSEPEPATPAGESLSLRVAVGNPLGLHARPAARLVQTAAGFEAEISVTNLTTGRGPAAARSVSEVATLGVRQGHEVAVAARGPQASEALAAIEALAARDFDDAPAPIPALQTPRRARRPAAGGGLGGLPASPGVAVGEARHFRTAVPEVPRHRAAEPEAEWRGLLAAIGRVRAEVSRTRASVAARAGEYEAAIFDAHLLMLDDEALLGPARRMIFEQGHNAADAWSSAAEAEATEYRRLDDAYLRARGDDLVDVARRVLVHLLGGETARPRLEGAGILVAPSLSPAETAAVDTELVRGIATAYGGPTSHAAILARSLGLPAVVGLGEEVLALEEGTPLLLDGEAGVVHVRPPRDLVDEHSARRAARDAARSAALAAAREAAVTRDGRRIEVAANLGSPQEIPGALEAGADAVGLLRTEFLFMDRDDMPDEEDQYVAYRAIAEGLRGRSLVLRTLDAGADKPLSYLPAPAEENPFLGNRGIRFALEHPELLATQLRAALRVAADGFPVKVMFPMVSTVEEYRRAAAILAEARSQVATPGSAVPLPEAGIMVEVPSAALIADRLASEVGFFSVGTNDLAQYTLAADRGNERVAALADPLHPAVLRLIRLVAQAAEAHSRWVGVCGEVAGDPLAAPILVGLGVTELSMSPPAIPLVKQAVRGIEESAARDLAERALELQSADEVRALLRQAGQAGPAG